MTPKEGIALIRQKLNSSDLARRMATGAFWSFFGTVAARLLTLVAGIVCARLLGKEQYGEFGMVRSTIYMFIAFGSMGIGLMATKYISEFRGKDPARVVSVYTLSNIFALCAGVLISAAILLSAPYLAEHNLHSPQLAGPIRLGALFLFGTVLNGAQDGTLGGFENFRAIAINNFIGSVVESVLMLVGAYYHGVGGAILGYGLGYCAIFVANQVSIRKNFRALGVHTLRRNIFRTDIKLLYTFCLPAALAGILVAPTLWVARSMLVRSDGFGQLAIFEAADQWKNLILFVPTTVNQIVLPILSSVQGSNQRQFWKVLNFNLLLNAAVAVLAVLVVAFFSPYIMKLYGRDFTDHVTMIILAVSAIFTCVGNVVGLSIASRAKMWIGFGFNAIWTVLYLAFAWLFLQWCMGASGLAWALLVAYFLHTVIQYAYLRRTARVEDITETP